MNALENNGPESWTRTPEGEFDDLEAELEERYKAAQDYVEHYLPGASEGLEMAALGMLNDQKEDLENPNMRQEVIQRLQLSEADAEKLDEFAGQLMIDRGWSSETVDETIEDGVPIEISDATGETGSFESQAESFDYAGFESGLIGLLQTLEQSEGGRSEKAEQVIAFLKEHSISDDDGNEVLPIIRKTNGFGRVKVSNLERDLREIAGDPSVGLYDSLKASERFGRLPTSSAEVQDNEPYSVSFDLIFNSSN